MTVIPWPAGQTPYVTPDQLYNTTSGTVTATQWPTGAQWSSIPYIGTGGTASAAQQTAVIGEICQAATHAADQYVNQPLRAVVTTEELSGPNYRVTVQWSPGNGRIIASRWPVTSVSAVMVSSNSAWPRQWTSLPAGNFEPEYPVDGLYGAAEPSSGAGGQGILFAPGYVNWGSNWPGGQISGRNAFRVSVTYTSGWPHACITAAGTAGATQLAVDDCTGWVLLGTNGGTLSAAGVIYDAMGGGQEPVTVASVSSPAGPGTISLSAPLNYAHAAGIAVSAMPQTVIWATALFAASIATARGATSTTIQTTGGRQQAARSLDQQARAMLTTFRRTV